jgi:hypothetical protein
VVERLEDILTQFGNRIADANEQNRAREGARPRLLLDHHPIRDFFIADAILTYL